MPRKVLIADDEQHILDTVGAYLKQDGFEVITVRNGRDAVYAFRHEKPDLVILDVMMPGTDGLLVCAEIRSRHNVPIIIVSARDSELDRVTGIAMGGDDYLVKPFSPIELTARVKALFRRIQLDRAPSLASLLTYGEITLNLDARSCTAKAGPIDLTPTEFVLLSYMFENSARAVSREELLKNVWKFDFEADTRATDDVLKRLRKKLTQTNVRIASVWGFGFKLALEEPV